MRAEILTKDLGHLVVELRSFLTGLTYDSRFGLTLVSTEGEVWFLRMTLAEIGIKAVHLKSNIVVDLSGYTAVYLGRINALTQHALCELGLSTVTRK